MRGIRFIPWLAVVATLALLVVGELWYRRTHPDLGPPTVVEWTTTVTPTPSPTG